MTTKNKERIMKYLLINKNSNNTVSKPENIGTAFKKISLDEIYDCLDVLDGENAIKVRYSDDGIYQINILPQGISYFENLKKEKADIRRTWWQMLLSGLLGFVLSIVAQFLVWKCGLLP